jgi:hypothetical protein
MPEDPEMFYDPTIVASWSALAGRLDDGAVLARWADAEPDLAGLNTVADLLAVWAEDGRDDRTNVVLQRWSGWPLPTAAVTTTCRY